MGCAMSAASATAMGCPGWVPNARPSAGMGSSGRARAVMMATDCQATAALLGVWSRGTTNVKASPAIVHLFLRLHH